MTDHKFFKRRVRARMERTGESYTAARAHLIPAPAPTVDERPASAGTGASTMRDRLSDARVAEATGHGYDFWFALLDSREGTTLGHTRIAAHLVEEHGLDGWWAPSITVAYEQERGLRLPGQKKDGFAISVSKTVNVPVERLFAAFADPEVRTRWLPTPVEERTTKENRRFTADLPENTRMAAAFQTKGEHKSAVGIEHTRFTDADRAARWKGAWRSHLADLANLLEE
ncbi:hypothetical protein [Nocardiopsis alba]|jgi:hypothetical protein|uniref:hypothetical protein n=1 Tax=Nocardiopsis alba TaxID=53437 RepID=UPI003631A02A